MRIVSILNILQTYKITKYIYDRNIPRHNRGRLIYIINSLTLANACKQMTDKNFFNIVNSIGLLITSLG